VEQTELFRTSLNEALTLLRSEFPEEIGFLVRARQIEAELDENPNAHPIHSYHEKVPYYRAVVWSSPLPDRSARLVIIYCKRSNPGARPTPIAVWATVERRA
jgi:hypothetical protein